MAASALDVISLAAMRDQLRIDGNAQDSLIVEAIESAVGFVERKTHIRLVDIDREFNVEKPRDHDPIAIRVRDVKNVVSVKYWAPVDGQTDESVLRLDPAGSIATSDLGRVTEISRYTAIYPPADGWPEIIRNTCFVVTVKVGLDLGDEHRSLRQAVILLARHFYESPERLESEFAVHSLIEPWVRWSDTV